MYGCTIQFNLRAVPMELSDATIPLSARIEGMENRNTCVLARRPVGLRFYSHPLLLFNARQPTMSRPRFATAGNSRVRTGLPSLWLFVTAISFSMITSAQREAINADEYDQKLIKFRVHCEHDPTAVGDLKVTIRFDKARAQQTTLNRQGFGSFHLNSDDDATINIEHPSLVVTPAWQQIFGSYANDKVFEFQARRTGIVHGRVTDMLTGSRVANVRIQVVDPPTPTGDCLRNHRQEGRIRNQVSGNCLRSHARRKRRLEVRPTLDCRSDRGYANGSTAA